MVEDEAQTGGVRSKKQRGEKKGARNTEIREKGERDGVGRGGGTGREERVRNSRDYIRDQV